MSPPRLASLLPAAGEVLDADEILSRFVSFVEDTGLELYPAQEEAILELLGGKHVVLATPTGSGKSLVATALHFLALARGERSVYTCPVKALVNEKFFALCQLFGAERVGMLTGDAAVNRDAPILCCTAEILANLALRGGGTDIAHVVMDEFHYYGDRDRGAAWQIPLLALPKTRFLLMSATLGETRPIELSIEELSRREVVKVQSAQRPVPLDFEYRETPLHETIADLLASRRYPVYLVHFTQRAAAEQAQALLSIDFCSKEEKEQLRQAMQDASFDTPFGKELSKLLRHGVGLHHAGLLPKYRLLVERLAQQGLLKLVCGTDTLGVGVNIPIRTVLFTQLCKFDGTKSVILPVREFHQIAGRAGRKGFDDRGAVVVQAPEHVIENLRLEQKAQAGGKKNYVKRQPPQKGYVHWDRATFERLLTRSPEALESRFEVTHGLILNVLQDPASGGYRRLLELVGRSHANDHVRRKQRRLAAARFRQLRQAGVVQVIRWEGRKGAVAELSAGLQRDFSLHTTLGLWLLDTWRKLDPATESYALDVLTLCESICENPDVVLWKQVDKLKGEKIAELKAQGMEYDDRMRELEKVEHPKPLADFVYATFNEFERLHPWVGTDDIRPKSVARELLERYCSFDDYVREYGLQRSEGVLLRYLSEVYKTVLQSVPEEARTEELEDVIAHLRSLVRGVDSSLLDEWERLRALGVEVEAPVPGRPAEGAPLPRPRRLADDPKAFAIRVRAELHRLMKAFADRDFDGLRAALRPGAIEWTDERLEERRAAYEAEHGRILLTPAARRPSQTRVHREGPQVWAVSQRLLDPEGHGDWALEGRVELAGDETDERPLVELLGIGG